MVDSFFVVPVAVLEDSTDCESRKDGRGRWCRYCVDVVVKEDTDTVDEDIRSSALIDWIVNFILKLYDSIKFKFEKYQSLESKIEIDVEMNYS